MSLIYSPDIRLSILYFCSLRLRNLGPIRMTDPPSLPVIRSGEISIWISFVKISECPLLSKRNQPIMKTQRKMVRFSTYSKILKSNKNIFVTIFLFDLTRKMLNYRKNFALQRQMDETLQSDQRNFLCLAVAHSPLPVLAHQRVIVNKIYKGKLAK